MLNPQLAPQLAKDTFYVCLRDRVAANNPARTVVVRGVTRPGVVTAESELPGAAVDGIAPADAFCLRWTGFRIDPNASLPLLALTCEIRYATDGTAGQAGMDRGRALAALDAELAAALTATQQSAPTQSFSIPAGGGATTVTATGTNIFWGDVTFAPAVTRGERMERTAQVEVFSYGQ